MKYIKKYENMNILEIPAFLVKNSKYFKSPEEKLKIGDYIVYPISITGDNSHYIPCQIIGKLFNFSDSFYDILNIKGEKETLSEYDDIYLILDENILEKTKNEIELIKKSHKYNI